AEQAANKLPGLLHKYRNRVLIIAAKSCAINCRYCFRRHFDYDQQDYSEKIWASWLDYIKSHPEIDEVILSGGEPLLLSDSKLTRLHDALASLPQLKRLRIHSRLPLVLPSRINQAFLELAEGSRLDWILVWHINHPNEISDEIVETAKKCRLAGITQLNQSVLLKNINDSAQILATLSGTLFDSNILP
ncbi:MAG: KamA family radical SAM protein, partial [Kangiellaceae bacterium]|nr:KamA family radical SAM protein [Kangiellaceae bacterium]